MSVGDDLDAKFANLDWQNKRTSEQLEQIRSVCATLSVGLKDVSASLASLRAALRDADNDRGLG
jgi:hypothetical protein